MKHRAVLQIRKVFFKAYRTPRICDYKTSDYLLVLILTFFPFLHS